MATAAVKTNWGVFLVTFVISKKARNKVRACLAEKTVLRERILG